MTLRVVAGLDDSLLFESPIEVWAPSTFEDALAALQCVERALDGGHWIAGAFSYEFGAFMHGITEREPIVPFFVLGAFPKPERRSWNRRPCAFEMSAPLSRVARSEYERRVEDILREIRDGEVYQVNYTVPFDIGFRGDPFDVYRFLARRARAPYSAFVQYGEISIASISPELFLRFDGGRLTTKPMKGTAPLSDLEQLDDPKNRAEHLMIVDLLRNDLHRVCTGVQVRRLFEVERYPTFATMTSTISGTLSRDATLRRILEATFPCGSVTGAPKRAAMRHIAAYERFARGFYTGSIGFLSPQRRGWWNVPIRTLQFLNEETARVDIGGGIVSDSRADGEWNEILLKSRFLQPAYRGFALLETYRGGPQGSDLGAHVDRLQGSARAFGLDLDSKRLEACVRNAANAREPQLVRVRAGRDTLTAAAEPLSSTAEPVVLALSELRVRSEDPFLRHKTAWRPVHRTAAREAARRNCFDVILRNERGELTEGSRTNIFVQIGNTLYTPPLSSGVLPGILRSRLVSEGKAVERVLFEHDLEAAEAIFAGNSARGLLQARLQRDG